MIVVLLLLILAALLFGAAVVRAVIGKMILGTGGLLMLLLLLGHCSKQEEPIPSDLEMTMSTPTYPVPRTLNELKIKVGSAWDFKMTREQYPQTAALLGDRFDEAEELTKWAGAVAAVSGTCDHVETSDVSDKSTRNVLLFFVDCTNERRFYVDEAEAKAAQVRWTK